MPRSGGRRDSGRHSPPRPPRTRRGDLRPGGALRVPRHLRVRAPRFRRLVQGPWAISRNRTCFAEFEMAAARVAETRGRSRRWVTCRLWRTGVTRPRAPRRAELAPRTLGVAHEGHGPWGWWRRSHRLGVSRPDARR